jgi:formate dehydrogenase iron-sulfur subunit
LPPDPVVPTKTVKDAWSAMAVGAVGMALAALGAALFSGKSGRP